jgi:bifunctional non-homologous end joining protein LigD
MPVSLQKRSTKAGSRRPRELPEATRLGSLPSFVEPSLALLVDKPPTGSQWVHEIKFDGYRIQARIDGDEVRLLTRKALDWTKRFPTIAEALRALHAGKALLDGEIVSEDEEGVPHFSDLQADLKSGRRDRLRYYVFDLLYLDRHDLTGANLLARKSLLEHLLRRAPAGSPLRYSEHSDENGTTMRNVSTTLRQPSVEFKLGFLEFSSVSRSRS